MSFSIIDVKLSQKIYIKFFGFFYQKSKYFEVDISNVNFKDEEKNNIEISTKLMLEDMFINNIDPYFKISSILLFNENENLLLMNVITDQNEFLLINGKTKNIIKNFVESNNKIISINNKFLLSYQQLYSSKDKGEENIIINCKRYFCVPKRIVIMDILEKNGFLKKYGPIISREVLTII